MTPLHVLHVIDGLGLGGAERMLIDIANRSVADGHRVSVCVTRSHVARAAELDSRIELVVLHRTRTLDGAATVRLVRWIREHRVDVVHAHMRSSTAFMLLLRATRLISAPIIFHDHFGNIELDRSVPPWFRLGKRFVAQYVGVYDQLSDWARDAGMPRERVTTIPNGLDLDRLAAPAPVQRSTLGVPDDALLGIVVATLRPAKGIPVLLDAIARTRNRDRMRVLVAGAEADDAYVAECRDKCRALGLESIVTLLGARDDVPGLLRAADFALLSSLTESGPLVLIEYAAVGLPFISTLVGDIGRRFAELGFSGFVPPGDATAFAGALDQLLDLPADERRTRGARGKDLLSAHWDIRAAMPRWYDIYRAVSR